jgi:hypothetical protein
LTWITCTGDLACNSTATLEKLNSTD